MRRMQTSDLFGHAMNRRRVFLGAGSLAASVCAPRLQAQSLETLEIAYPVDLPSWDPTAVTFPPGQSIFKSVFDSPLHYSSELKLLAQQIRERRWLDGSYTRLEVTLRDGITFHDGSALSAEDLRFSWIERPAADKKLAVSGMLADLKDVEVLSATKAVLVFAKPFPAAEIFLGFLTAYILPKAYLLRVGPEGFQRAPIGAGPYRLAQYEKGSRIVLQAYEKYWGAAPQFKRVVFHVMPEPSARVKAVEAGRVDIATQLPFIDALRFFGNPDLTMSIYPQAELYMLQVPSYVDTFKDKRVRMALHMSVDKRALSKSLFAGVAKPLHVLATPGSPGDVPDYRFPYDPQQAVRLLKEAGYDAARPLEVTLLSSNGSFPNDAAMAAAIAQMWSDIGVKVLTQEVTVAKYLEMSHSQKLPGVMLYSWANATGDPENTAGRILNPSLRFATWKDPALGKRIAELQSMSLSPERLEGFKRLVKDASDNSWSIPLLQSVNNFASKRTLSVPTHGAGYLLPAEVRHRR